MLEGVLAQVVESAVGKYVDGIDKKAAKLSVWSGKIALRDLKLKESAFDDLDLPVKLVYGHLDELHLDIPWKNLSSKPPAVNALWPDHHAQIIVRITGLHVILRSNTDATLSAEDKEQREAAAKRAVIDEMDAAGANAVKAADESKQSFSSRLVAKIVDNVQLDITDIHLRYEDRFSDADHPFALGLMLSRFSSQSTDTSWRPAFVENQKVLHKLSSMEGLCVYVDSDAPVPADGSTSLLGADFKAAMADMVRHVSHDPSARNAAPEASPAKGGSSEGRPSFVVRPIDASCRIKMNKSEVPDATSPKLDVALQMECLNLQLEKRQYRDMIHTLDFIGNHERISRYNQFRPSVEVKGHAREWWQFAVRCLSWERQLRLQRFDKDRVFRLIVLWPKYARLYKRRFAAVLGLPELDPAEEATLREMEAELPLDAIRAARDAVHETLAAKVQELEAEKRQRAEQGRQATGWYGTLASWVPKWGGGGGGPKGGEDAVYRLTRKEAEAQLMAEMGIDVESTHGGEESGGGGESSDVTQTRVEFTLSSGSLFLLSHHPDGAPCPIAKLNYNTVRAAMLQRQSSMEVTLQLGVLSVHDLFTPDVAHPFNKIVSRWERETPQHTAPTAGNAFTQAALGLPYVSGGWGLAKSLVGMAPGWTPGQGSSTATEEHDTPLVWFNYVSCPQDANVDSRMVVRMESLALVYNPRWLARLNDFLDVGSSPALQHLQQSAAETLERAQKMSEENLKTALSAKMVTDLCLDLKSPVIFVPESVEERREEAPVLVLQPGNLSMWSMRAHLADTSEVLQEMVHKDQRQGHDDRYYNTLLLELSEVRTLVCERSHCRQAARDVASFPASKMIDDIRVSICVDNSIAPSNSALTRTKVRVALPELSVNFSSRKYAAVMDILAAVSADDGQQGGGQQPAEAVEARAVEEERRKKEKKDRKEKKERKEKKTKKKDKDKERDREKDNNRDGPRKKSMESSVPSHTEEVYGGVALKEWKHLDVLVAIAPRSALALNLFAESAAGDQLPIANLRISKVKVGYLSLADGSSNLEAHMATIEADDTRPDTANKLVAPRDAEKHILTVKAVTEPDGVSDYVLWFGHIDIVLIPDALLAIASVADRPPPAAVSEAGGASSSQGRGKSREGTTTGPSEPSRPASVIRRQSSAPSTAEVPAATGAAAAVGEEQKLMVVRVYMLQPRVTLVEDAADAAARRLTLQSSLMARHAFHPDGSQAGHVHLQDLRLTVQHHVERAGAQDILQPASLSVEYVLSKEGGTDAQVMARDMDVRITYQNLVMLYGMYRNLLGGDVDAAAVMAGGSKEEEEEEEEEGGVDSIEATRAPGRMQGAATTTKSLYGTSKLMSDPGDSAAGAGAEGAKAAVDTHYRVDLGTLALTVVNDCAGFNQPFATLSLLELHAVQDATADGDSCMEVRGRAQLALYNHKVAEFEPVIEEWGLDLQSVSQVSPAGILDSGVRAHGALPTSVQMYRLASAEVLNVNLTESHLSAVVSTLSAWQADWPVSTSVVTSSAEPASPRACASAYSAYRLVNRCGVAVRVRNVLESGAEGRAAQTVGAHQTEPLSFNERFWTSDLDALSPARESPARRQLRRQHSRDQPRPDRSVAILVGSGDDEDGEGEGEGEGAWRERAFRLSVEAATTQVVHLPGGARVLAEVETFQDSSSRTVTVHSQLCVANSCQEPLELHLASDAATVFRRHLLPGQTIDLPPSALPPGGPFGLRAAVRRAEVEGAGWTEPLTVEGGLDEVVKGPGAGEDRWPAFHVRTVVRVKEVKGAGGEGLELVELCLMPVMAIKNLLPCAVSVSFMLEGSVPMASYSAESGEEVAIHDFALQTKVYVGFSLGSLQDCEYVPVFNPEGEAASLDRHVNLFDSRGDLLRLQLEHHQEPEQLFRAAVFAPYWFVNRTGLPLEFGQKWTASNVSLLGGQHSESLERSSARSGPSRSAASSLAGVDLRDLLSGAGVQPVPFSFHYKVDVGGAKATMRLGAPHARFSSRENKLVACEWSSAFSIESVGSTLAVELVSESTTYELVLQVSLARGLFHRTKAVTILPRYVVCNQLRQPVELGQVGCEEVSARRLGQQDMAVIAWTEESKDRRVSIHLLPDAAQGHEDWQWGWSGGILPHTVGYSPLKVRAGRSRGDGGHEVFNMMVHTSVQGPMTLLTIHEQNENPAILVQNNSSWATTCYRQLGVPEDRQEAAAPGEASGFCWDDPHAAPVLTVTFKDEAGQRAALECNMDRLGVFPAVSVAGRTLCISVVARGPTKVLMVDEEPEREEWTKVTVTTAGVIRTEREEPSGRRPSRPGQEVGAGGGGREGGSAVVHCSVELAGVGVSVIDGAPSELLYMSALGLKYKGVTSGDWELTELRAERFQIDNQTMLGSPVLLGQGVLAPAHTHPEGPGPGPGPGAETAEEYRGGLHLRRVREAELTPSSESFLALKVAKNLRNTSLDCYDAIEVSVADTAIDCDERLLTRLLATFSGILSKLAPPPDQAPASSQHSDDVGSVGSVDLSVLESERSADAMRWTYIETLRISPIKVLVSFSAADDAHGLLDGLGPLSKLPVFAFVEAFKAMVTNLDRAPILLRDIHWERPFLPREELTERVTKHYVTSVMGGFYRLVGSLELLGNPTGLVSNIGEGFSGLVDNTREGFRQGRIVQGVTSGAGSLAAGTVQGVFGSAAGLSGAMGKGLAQLTFDGDYKRAKSMMDQDRPLHVGQGVLKGGRSLGRGLLLGVTGVVTQPIKGYSRHGARGAIKGVGKGLVGAVVKPMAGVAELVAKTSEGLRNTPEYMSRRALLTRVRLPRQWQPGTPVRGFDRRSALGVAMLSRVAARQGWTEQELLVEHAAWDDAMLGPVVVFITSARLILCSLRRRRSPARPLPSLRVKLAAPLESIRRITDLGTSIDIALDAHHSDAQCLPLSARGRRAGEWRLSVPDEALHVWLLLRLRGLSQTERSDLAGGDWVLLGGKPQLPSVRAAALRRVEAGAVLARLAVSVESTLAERCVQYRLYCHFSAGPRRSAADRDWIVHRRYSDFVALRILIEREEAAAAANNPGAAVIADPLPPLPPKRLFGNKSSGVILERVRGLDNFISKILTQNHNRIRVQLMARFLMVVNQGQEIRTR